MTETPQRFSFTREILCSRSECFNDTSDSWQQEVIVEAGEIRVTNNDTANLQNTLFIALELSRATSPVAVFAPRLGNKISVHSVPGGDAARLLQLVRPIKAGT